MGQNLSAYREETLTFKRKNSHDLAKLLRSLTKESEDAVGILVTLMKSQDEKLRFQAASKLLDLQRQVAEDINKDNITRTLLESKNSERSRSLTPEEQDNVPLVDFGTILDVE